MRPTLLRTSCLVILLSGCAVGPDFQRPTPPTAAGYGPEAPMRPIAAVKAPNGEAQNINADHPLAEKWWQAFGSPGLDELVEQALAANPTIDAAKASLRQYNALVSAQVGYFFPTLSAGLGLSRSLAATGTVQPTAITGNPYLTLYSAQLGISYVVDVFGANRRAVESAAAQAEQQQFLMEAAITTLANSVVVAAINEASLRGQVEATEKTIAIETNLLGILNRQVALGQVAVADMVAQEAALAQVQQTLPPLRKQLSQQRDMLAALLGRPPSEMPAARFTLDDLHLPTELPASLPAQLVDQRPDVRAAEAAMHAASAQVGIAVAARLPQLQIVGNAGNSPSRYQDFFTPGTNFWSISAGLAAPIFDGGTLMFRQRAAQAAFDQAAAQYKSTAIAGMQNVADTLAALDADAAGLAASSNAERAAAHSLEITQRQLALGQISYPQLLLAQQTYQSAVVNLVQARAARLTDTAALFQALGGGWWNRTAPEQVAGK